MKMVHRSAGLSLAIVCVLAAFAVVFASATAASAQDDDATRGVLLTPPGSGAENAVAINASGTIVVGGAGDAVVYSSDSAGGYAVTTLPGPSSTVDINDAGVIAIGHGTYDTVKMFVPNGAGGYDQTELDNVRQFANFVTQIELAADGSLYMLSVASRESPYNEVDVSLFRPDGVGGWHGAEQIADWVYEKPGALRLGTNIAANSSGVVVVGGVREGPQVIRPDGAGGYERVALGSAASSSAVFVNDAGLIAVGRGKVYEPDGVGGYVEVSGVPSDVVGLSEAGVVTVSRSDELVTFERDASGSYVETTVRPFEPLKGFEVSGSMPEKIVLNERGAAVSRPTLSEVWGQPLLYVDDPLNPMQNRPFRCYATEGYLEWAEAGAAKYWVYESTDDGVSFQFQGAVSGATAFLDRSPAPGTLYQVHYQGIPRVDCETTREPESASLRFSGSDSAPGDRFGAAVGVSSIGR